MSWISYEQAWADRLYLWSEYGPADDMTGAYVDQGDLEKLLRSPTKATACACLCRQIDYWFRRGPCETDRQPDPTDERLQEIAERHGATL